MTAAQEPATDLVSTAAPRPAVDWRAQLARWLVPADPPRRVTPRAALLATAGTLPGVIISRARTGGHGPFDSIWAEDGNWLLYGALNLRVDGPRTKVPPWSGVVAKAEAECKATGVRRVRVRNGGDVWYPWIDVPCRKLVGDRNVVSNKNG